MNDEAWKTVTLIWAKNLWNNDNYCFKFDKLNIFQIENRKLEWNTSSKVGSLHNAKHKAGGGNVKVSLLT